MLENKEKKDEVSFERDVCVCVSAGVPCRPSHSSTHGSFLCPDRLESLHL